MSATPTIWLTRPPADSALLAAALQPIQSIIAPLMEIETLYSSPIRGEVRRGANPNSVRYFSPPPNLPPNGGGVKCPDAILLTSRHAAHALLPAWSQLPVYCVGTATAEAARVQGFSNVILGKSDILSLLPRIAELLKHKNLLYLSGENVSVDVAALLASQSVSVERVIAYRAIAATQLTAEIIDALKNNSLTGTVFFSARTAEIATTLLTQAELSHAVTTVDAYCLSLAIAEKAAALPWRRIHVAHIPTSYAMEVMIATFTSTCYSG